MRTRATRVTPAADPPFAPPSTLRELSDPDLGVGRPCVQAAPCALIDPSNNPRHLPPHVQLLSADNALCTGYFTRADGSGAIAIIADYDEGGGKTNTGAVVGGTGRYEGTKGTVTILEVPSTTDPLVTYYTYTYKLT